MPYPILIKLPPNFPAISIVNVTKNILREIGTDCMPSPITTQLDSKYGADDIDLIQAVDNPAQWILSLISPPKLHVTKLIINHNKLFISIERSLSYPTLNLLPVVITVNGVLVEDIPDTSLIHYRRAENWVNALIILKEDMHPDNFPLDIIF